MAIVTIDAKGELAEFIAQSAPEPAEKPAEKPEATKKAPEPAQETAQSAEKVEADDPDDIEGEDGLTTRQKRELSAKMLKAIGKKHREMKEAEEFAAAQYSEKRLAEARAAALEQELQKLRGAQPVPRETADPEAGKPQRDKFANDEAYWEAVIDWRADRKAAEQIAKQRVEDQKAAEERRKVEIETAAASRITRARELVPDFAEIGAKAQGNISQVVSDYLLKSEMIAELTYHLAQHPGLVEKLAKLPPDEQLVTIGKIEGMLKPFEPQGSKGTNGATPSTAAKTNGNASHEDEPSETGSIPSRARGTAPVITPLTSTSSLQVEPDARDMTTRQRIELYQKTHKVQLVGLRKRH